MFTVILASTESNGIGWRNQLPWRIKGDMSFFKKVTTTNNEAGHENTIIMGRKTWESIPEKHRSLPGRLNVVLTRQLHTKIAGATIAGSLKEGLAIGEKQGGRIFVIGGAEIYNVAMNHPECECIYWTKVRRITNEAVKCDVFVNNLPRHVFALCHESTQQWIHEGEWKYKIQTYQRI